MKDEMTYVLITPYTLVKSRTGGVLSRLLSRLDLDLIAAQIVAFDHVTAEKYADSVLKGAPKKSSKIKGAKLLHRYILDHIAPSVRPHRTALFLLRGKNAVKKVRDLCGALYPENRTIYSMTGETIRDTYADLLFDEDGKVVYFEPAVLTPRTRKMAEKNLRIFTNFMKGQDNIIKNVVYKPGQKIERTLVIIKPDNWHHPSAKPGTIIDMFARTGLRIVGCKIYKMSLNEGLNFYSNVKSSLVKKLSPRVGSSACNLLEDHFSFKLSQKARSQITKTFGGEYAKDQFYRIVQFMTGRRPDECGTEDTDKEGKVKVMLIVYEGPDAVSKIRGTLGPTNPDEAPGGTIRADFGSDIMVNTAHASDSTASALREIKVVKMHDNNFADICENDLP